MSQNKSTNPFQSDSDNDNGDDDLNKMDFRKFSLFGFDKRNKTVREFENWLKIILLIAKIGIGVFSLITFYLLSIPASKFVVKSAIELIEWVDKLF